MRGAASASGVPVGRGVFDRLADVRVRVGRQAVEKVRDARRRPVGDRVHQGHPDRGVGVVGQVGQLVQWAASAHPEPVERIRELGGVPGIARRGDPAQEHRCGGGRAVQGVRAAPAQAL